MHLGATRRDTASREAERAEAEKRDEETRVEERREVSDRILFIVESVRTVTEQWLCHQVRVKIPLYQ